jgi:hypothetical protein
VASDNHENTQHAVPLQQVIALRASRRLAPARRSPTLTVEASLCACCSADSLDAWCRATQPAATHVAVHEVCGFV